MICPSTPSSEIDLSQRTAALCFLPLDRKMTDLQKLADAPDSGLREWAHELGQDEASVRRLREKLRWIVEMTGKNLPEFQQSLQAQEKYNVVADTRGRVLATLEIEGCQSIPLQTFESLDQQRHSLQRQIAKLALAEDNEAEKKGRDQKSITFSQRMPSPFLNLSLNDSDAIDGLSTQLENLESILRLALAPKADKMHQWGRRADKMLKDIVARFFPGGKSRDVELLPSNDVTPLDDIAALLAIICDESWTNNQRFQADRKLEIMLLCQAIDNILHERRRDLQFLSDLFQSRIYSINGHKRGYTKQQRLVTTHDPENENRCIAYEFLDQAPDELEENQYIETISFRTIEIDMPNGEKKKIDFMVHLDQKDELSILLKAIRYPDRSLEKIFRDFNRGRLLFKSEEDQDLVINELKRRFESKDHRWPMHEVKMDKVKAGVGGTTDNPTINCYKFNMTIDGRDYEFQSFADPKEYANYFLIDNESNDAWCNNEILRFFKLASYVLFPDSEYPGLNREEIMREAMDLAHRAELISRGGRLKNGNSH